MTIVKSFLIPKLLYVCTILETPQEIIKQMERMLYKFLLKGPDKVTRLSIINSLKNGGLNLMDLETQIKALRVSWIPRVLDERVGPWKSNFEFHLKKYGGSLLLKCDYDIHVRDLNLRLNIGGPSSRCEELLFFIFMRTFRDIVTAVVYCYITTKFHYAKRDSGLLAFGGVMLQQFEF